MGRRACSRSSSPPARSSPGPSRGVGAIATQAYANPRYGPDGLALLREGLSAEEVVERLTAADEGRDAAAARRRRRAGPKRHVHGRRVPRLGRRPHRARATRRRATSSSRRRPSTRWRRRSRAAPAGRSPSGSSTASRRRRRRAATGAASRRPGCSSSSATAATPGCRTSSSTCASTTMRARSRSCGRIYGLHGAIFGKTPREEWLDVDEALAAELRERLARLGYEGELARRARPLGGHRELEDAGGRGRARSTRSCSPS